MRAVHVCVCVCMLQVGGWCLVMSVISDSEGHVYRVCVCVFCLCMHVCFIQSGNMTLQLAFSVILLAICLAAVQWQQ